MEKEIEINLENKNHLVSINNDLDKMGEYYASLCCMEGNSFIYEEYKDFVLRVEEDELTRRKMLINTISNNDEKRVFKRGNIILVGVYSNHKKSVVVVKNNDVVYEIDNFESIIDNGYVEIGVN